MPRLLKKSGLLAALPLVSITSALLAQNITTFDAPNSTYTHPTSINAKGQITGDFLDANGAQHGFLLERTGAVLTIDVPDYIDNGLPVHVSTTVAVSINAAGRIAGYYYFDTAPPGGLRWHGFIRKPGGAFITFAVTDFVLPTAINHTGAITGSFDSGRPSPRLGFVRAADGTVTEFQAPGATYTFPADINAKGQVTGRAYGYDTSVEHAFLREADASLITVDVPGATNTVPTAMNTQGQITGFYSDGTPGYHAFLRAKDGTFTSFDVPSSVSTVPSAINPARRITGFYTDESQVYHGFVRQKDGSFATFDVPNAINTYPTAMNSKNQITGWYSDASGRVHGFAFCADACMQ